MASNMLNSCPASLLRRTIADTHKQLDKANGLLKDHFAAVTQPKRKARGVARASRALAGTATVVVGTVLAVKSALWLANGTIDNACTLKAGVVALHRRIFGNSNTDSVRSAMETLSNAVVISEDEERENQEAVDALADDDPPGLHFDADNNPCPEGGCVGGGDRVPDVLGTGDAPVGRGGSGAADGAAGRSPSTRRRGRGAVVAEFKIGGKTYKLDGYWALLAFRAKERFRSVEYASYNQAALSRWLDNELKKKENLRWVDRRNNLRIVELFVWYVDDAEKAIADAFAELKADGRIRSRTD